MNSTVSIPKDEFKQRVERVKQSMQEAEIQICLIYGDEYRKENLRYMSNYWPLFERGAAIIPLEGEPIIVAAPEGERLCREMAAWENIVLIPEFACVTVPDKIEYPQANYTSLLKIRRTLENNQTLQRLGIVGMDAMPEALLRQIKADFDGLEIVDCNDILHQLRKNKTTNEIACLREAARIADEGYKLIINQAKPGMTELELASLAIAECTRLGAEAVPFCLLTSGERVNTIIGRATTKTINNQDMIMAAIAVQVEGYVATIGFPFVVGTMSEGQRQFISLLVEAEELALGHLRPGASQGELVQAVKRFFQQNGVAEYDLYPPLHGCGLAEAESPYPDEHSTALFAEGMTVNTDVSLFGHPDGSNRIEESLLVTADGYTSLSPLIRQLSRTWREQGIVEVQS